VAHEALLIETGHGPNASQHSHSIRRCDLNPAVARFKAHTHNQVEAHLLEKEPLAALLIVPVNAHEVQAKIRVLAVEARSRAFVPEGVLNPLFKPDNPVGQPTASRRRVVIVIVRQCGFCCFQDATRPETSLVAYLTAQDWPPRGRILSSVLVGHNINRRFYASDTRSRSPQGNLIAAYDSFGASSSPDHT